MVRRIILLPLVAAALAASAGTAVADDGHIGVRETVCADDLFVRVGPSDGAWMGTLYRGETFTVDGRQGTYVHGFAYGHVNRDGWVRDGYFC